MRRGEIHGNEAKQTQCARTPTAFHSILHTTAQKQNGTIDASEISTCDVIV